MSVGPDGLTKPKPFCLLTDARASVVPSLTVPSSPFISLASQVSDWLGSAGPDRLTQTPITGAHGATHITATQEFKFATSERVKEKPITSEERIMQEIEAARSKEKERVGVPRPSASFRAPHASVSDPSRVSVSVAPLGVVTQVEPFHLSGSGSDTKPRIDQAAIDQAALEKERSERKKRLLAAAKQNGITVAQAPQLAVLQRIPLKEIDKPSLASDGKSTSVAASVPLPLTSVAPFHLSTAVRGAVKCDSFAAKLSSDCRALQAASTFKASPMPVADEPNFTPTVPHRQIQPDRPPNLRGLHLHQASEKQFKAQLAAEEAAAQAQRDFHAKPTPTAILHAPTFTLHSSSKCLTAALDPSLESTRRAESRHQFDCEIAGRTAAAQASREREEAERAKEEAKQIKKYRETLVPKTNKYIKPAAAFRPPR